MEGRISILIDVMIIMTGSLLYAILFILVFKKVRNPGKMFGIPTPTLDNIMPATKVFNCYYCVGLIIKHHILTCIAEFP